MSATLHSPLGCELNYKIVLLTINTRTRKYSEIINVEYTVISGRTCSKGKKKQDAVTHLGAYIIAREENTPLVKPKIIAPIKNNTSCERKTGNVRYLSGI